MRNISFWRTAVLVSAAAALSVLADDTSASSTSGGSDASADKGAEAAKADEGDDGTMTVCRCYMRLKGKDAAWGARHNQRMLQLFDKDKDGKLSDAEKEDARETVVGHMFDRCQNIVQAFDTDKDGKLSEAEQAAAADKIREGKGRFGKRLGSESAAVDTGDNEKPIDVSAGSADDKSKSGDQASSEKADHKDWRADLRREDRPQSFCECVQIKAVNPDQEKEQAKPESSTSSLK